MLHIKWLLILSFFLPSLAVVGLRNWTQVCDSSVCQNGWSGSCKWICWKCSLRLLLVLEINLINLCARARINAVMQILTLDFIWHTIQGTLCCMDNSPRGHFGHVTHYSSCYVGWYGNPRSALFSTIHSWLSSGMVLTNNNICNFIFLLNVLLMVPSLFG